VEADGRSSGIRGAGRGYQVAEPELVHDSGGFLFLAQRAREDIYGAIRTVPRVPPRRGVPRAESRCFQTRPRLAHSAAAPAAPRRIENTRLFN